jgi:hypothetical protein
MLLFAFCIALCFATYLVCFFYIELCFYVSVAYVYDYAYACFIFPNTDFSLCIKCQRPGGVLVNSPHPESYSKFLEAVSLRAELLDGEFPVVNRRLLHVSAADLIGNASWHSDCYKETIHSGECL